METYYYIYVEYYYQVGTYLAPKSGKLCYEKGTYDRETGTAKDTLVLFSTRELAEQHLSEMGVERYATISSGKKLYAQTDTYLLSHGEYESPTYTIHATKKTEYKKYGTFIKSA